MNRHDLYEPCVQSPTHIVPFLHAAHGRNPRILAEDFCGTAAISRLWAAAPDHSAMCIDSDLNILFLARLWAQEAGVQRLSTRYGILPAQAPPVPPADIIFVGNFSVGYIHKHADLLAYLRACRKRLNPNGIFVCDMYGGASAFRIGGIERKHPGRNGETIRYLWAHDTADPLTGIVENSISFRVEIDGQIVEEHPRVFTYRWRLWSIAELREAMAEAGFTASDVYTEINAGARPLRDPKNLGEDWVVCIVARR